MTTRRPLTILLFNTANRWIGEAAGTDLLARMLHARGHRVFLFLPNESPIAGHVRAECEIVRGSWRLSGGGGASLPRQYLDTARLLRRIQPDIIHVGRGQEHWCTALLKPLCAPTACLVRTRHVVLPMRQTRANRWLFRNRTDAVTAVSEATMRGVGALADHLPPERRRVVLGAVDLQRYRPENRSDSQRAEAGITAKRTLLLGCLGRWQNIKGPDIFMEAASRIMEEHPHVHAVLAGRKVHHENAKLRALHEKWNLEGRITYLGMIEKPEGLVASLDIGAIASRGSEGFSRIAVEYMASGVPFVATRVGALPQIVRDGETGLLVPPEDVDAMTEAIRRLVADPQLRARLAGNALTEVRERFDPSRYGEEMEEVYYSALAARHG
ncbi:MAG: hypothetical protein PWP23_20 [Candidatus Sumerlaeota bacterium]|nr:hypothetical protein [Candidatus Sumerlaeota bacterium]